MGKLPDDEIDILNQIKHGNQQDREQALKVLYQNQKIRSWMSNHVFNNGGTKEDFKDLIQETFITFDKNVRLEKFRGESTIETYIIGIAKNIWRNQFRKIKNKKHLPLDSIDTPATNPVSKIDNQDYNEQILKKTSSKCRQLLLLQYRGFSYKEMARMMDISSAEVCKTQIFRCRQALRKLFKNLDKKSF